MGTYTANLNLTKPDLSDNVSITTLNNNFDLIDAAIASVGSVSTVYTGTLSVANWTGASAPYTQTLSISGILSSDKPIVDMVPSPTYADAMAQLEGWGYIYRITTATDSITVYATDKPTVAVYIQLLVVRR